uniref:Isoform 4 of OVARIAN TUMOR DOMAIN-containing deubiquitinating enzyme 4 n=1 Tax=Arabidopsis thaliana TaxID=3702 RepID=Q8LBZ4-4|nr:OTU-conraining deubiquitinating enzyme 4 isoform iib [Arabidopsis thaliana]
MMICYSPITTCSRNAISIKRHLGSRLYGVVAHGSSKFSCYSLLSGLSRRHYTGFRVSVSNRPSSWHDKGLFGFAYTGVIVSLLVCYSSTSQSAYADSSRDKDANNVHHHSSDGKFHNGKRVYTDYSIIGIPGDGRCLFRSVAHGFCLRSGKLAPGEKMQRELADELRTRTGNRMVRGRRFRHLRQTNSGSTRVGR